MLLSATTLPVLWIVEKGGGSTILPNAIDASAERCDARLHAGLFCAGETDDGRKRLAQRGGQSAVHVGGGRRHGGYFLWSQAVTADTGAAIVETTQSE